MNKEVFDQLNEYQLRCMLKGYEVSLKEKQDLYNRIEVEYNDLSKERYELDEYMRDHRKFII